MTEKMLMILVDAMALAFERRYAQPMMGWLNDSWVDFSIVFDGWVPCDKADFLVKDVDEVREFCEFFNEKNIKVDEVDEAIADREKFVNKVADMIRNKEYEKAFETLKF